MVSQNTQNRHPIANPPPKVNGSRPSRLSNPRSPITKFFLLTSIYNVLSISPHHRKEILMPDSIPEKYRDLFQKRAFASLATLMPDGRPQVTPSGATSMANTSSSTPPRVVRKTRMSAAIRVSRSPSSIPKIPTAMSRFAAASLRSPKRAPAPTSIRWPRNISASTNIPTASPAKSA